MLWAGVTIGAMVTQRNRLEDTSGRFAWW